MPKKEITLIGAGLVGCLLSIYLSRRGFSVKIFESRPDIRNHKIPAGRSINLSLSERGIHALKEVGLYRNIEKYLIEMPGRMLHDKNGVLQYQAYGRNPGDVHFSVSRAVLNKILLDAAESTERVSIQFNEYCSSLNLTTKRLSLRNETTSESRTLDFDVLIGVDGAWSIVRQSMINAQAIQCKHEILPHGYKELNIPEDPRGGHRMEKNALHIWPRGGFMLIALPNTDNSFTVTLFLPHEGSNSFESLTSDPSILDFFQTQFPDAVPLIPNLKPDFYNNPTGSLGTIRCSGWHLGAKALVIGDAAHAVVPFHGQGMNCGFEDCSVLNKCFDSSNNIEDIFEAFSKQRISNTKAIADMALENYIEMRDSVRNPKFHLWKQIEWLLEERHPKRFIPRYSMVMFHRIPYSVVKERGNIQSTILHRLSKYVGRVEEVDVGLADQLVKEKLGVVRE